MADNAEQIQQDLKRQQQKTAEQTKKASPDRGEQAVTRDTTPSVERTTSGVDHPDRPEA